MCGGRVCPRIREPLSYRNGVARSQPFNELGQLTLYAQSFSAFRFYVNFNSLPPNLPAKECVHRWVARAHTAAGTRGQVYPRPPNRNRRNIAFPTPCRPCSFRPIVRIVIPFKRFPASVTLDSILPCRWANGRVSFNPDMREFPISCLTYFICPTAFFIVRETIIDGITVIDGGVSSKIKQTCFFSRKN